MFKYNFFSSVDYENECAKCWWTATQSKNENENNQKNIDIDNTEHRMSHKSVCNHSINMIHCVHLGMDLKTYCFVSAWIPNVCVLNSIFMVVLSAILKSMNWFSLKIQLNVYIRECLVCVCVCGCVLKRRHRILFCKWLIFWRVHTTMCYTRQYNNQNPKNKTTNEKTETVNQPTNYSCVTCDTLTANTLSHAWNSFVWH